METAVNKYNIRQPTMFSVSALQAEAFITLAKKNREYLAKILVEEGLSENEDSALNVIDYELEDLGVIVTRVTKDLKELLR